MGNQICEKCRYYIAIKEYCGLCRRFPPPPQGEGFPKINSNSWCGEFKENDETKN